MFDHPARRLTDPPDECSKCGLPIEGADENLRHVGEPLRPRIRPARADVPAFNRAALVAAQALDGLTWAPGLDNRDRGQVIAEALYSAGLLAAKPRSVQPRRTPAA
ncbi:hypothetical protein [Actinomadura violacea]|uniref:Uncharacterized protein n=1 Tax=Actinomadura violacea TaxID=2819934 RepID=A0ABS3S4T2_9ACTN|nr:hypothetical protein [Actinomadura violacea]MBO2464010.1 hypothetical protein [Actinomadura violacea]